LRLDRSFLIKVSATVITGQLFHMVMVQVRHGGISWAVILEGDFYSAHFTRGGSRILPITPRSDPLAPKHSSCPCHALCSLHTTMCMLILYLPT